MPIPTDQNLGLVMTASDMEVSYLLTFGPWIKLGDPPQTHIIGSRSACSPWSPIGKSWIRFDLL